MSNDQRGKGLLALPGEPLKDSLQGESASGLPEHLLSLDADQWALWHFVCLRGAGFPARLALALSSPACASLVDQYIFAEETCARTRSAALETLNNELREATGERHALLVKAFRTINKTYAPQALSLSFPPCETVDAFRVAYERLAHLQQELPGAFDAATLLISRAIHALAGTDRFREAVLWQNRQAVRTGLETLLRSTPEQTARQAKRRSNEALVANYIQRYALKNDSIGFFGPIGCATIAASGKAIEACPGPRLLEQRQVYFEGWCIEELAETLVERNRELLPWCAPRQMPHMYLEGTLLHVPFAPPVRLSSSQAAVFRACTGTRSAKVIARELLNDSTNGIQSEAQVYALLNQLCASKRIVWTLEIPPEGNAPEQALRYWLERIEETALRHESLAFLDRMEQARAGVAQAAGNADRLEQALVRLEEEFVELTSKTATRAEGKTYAGRTLLYEDCRRAINVTIGPDLVQSMRDPLLLLLTSARWYTYEVAGIYEQAFRDAYLELRADTDTTTVDLTDFWLWMQPFFADDEQRLSDILLPEFQQHWQEIFAMTDEQRGLHRLEYRSSELRERVQQHFAAPAPGWNAACYHSPDVLLEAKDVAALQNGEYQVILGEFHIAMNTLQITAFLAQHPHPEEILQAANLDVRAPRIWPILSKDAFSIYRLRPSLITPKDFYLIYTPDVCAPPQTPVTTLTLSSLVVEEVEGRLIARTRDGCYSFELIEVFAEFLSRLVYGSFKMFPAHRHTPRITIDRMVVSRESWCFAPQDLPFAFDKAPLERFMATRRWALSQELPRFIFVKVPTEPKPCFLDLASPIFVEIFLKMVRQNMREAPETGRPPGIAPTLAITEMLPGPDHLWLQDKDGEHYTSELRFVAVDQVRC